MADYCFPNFILSEEGMKVNICISYFIETDSYPDTEKL
jgi:hypothetical protein